MSVVSVQRNVKFFLRSAFLIRNSVPAFLAHLWWTILLIISNDLEHLSVLHMQLCVNKLCNRMDRDNTDSRDGGV